MSGANGSGRDPLDSLSSDEGQMESFVLELLAVVFDRWAVLSVHSTRSHVSAAHPRIVVRVASVVKSLLQLIIHLFFACLSAFDTLAHDFLPLLSLADGMYTRAHVHNTIMNGITGATPHHLTSRNVSLMHATLDPSTPFVLPSRSFTQQGSTRDSAADAPAPVRL